jgi:hypothetical protein
LPYQVLSVDLAMKSYKRIGFCVLEGTRGHSKAIFLPPSELKLAGRTDPADLASTILRYCEESRIKVILLDGPQGWKDPESELRHCRVCEKELFTPAKTGTPGNAKPGSALGFIQFCIDVFSGLVERGAELVERSPIEIRKPLLAVETFPTSAWRSLGLKPLPSARNTKPGEIERRTGELRDKFGVVTEAIPSHDELQALVAGLAGLSILEGNPSGYRLAGSPPIYRNGILCEGFIVNPCLQKND